MIKNETHQKNSFFFTLTFWYKDSCAINIEILQDKNDAILSTGFWSINIEILQTFSSIKTIALINWLLVDKNDAIVLNVFLIVLSAQLTG